MQSKARRNQLNLLHGTKNNRICSKETVNSQESVKSVQEKEWVFSVKDL